MMSADGLGMTIETNGKLKLKYILSHELSMITICSDHVKDTMSTDLMS